ncbi:MAG: hypothetical protein Q7S92_07255 [Candidatus Diapherotrites archaeon]|nr:hypothetical protein [Candidatus Diapherotrites archaeon]
MKTLNLEKAIKLRDMIKELEIDMTEIDQIAAKIRERKGIKSSKRIPTPQQHVKILEEIIVPPLELIHEEHAKKEKHAH